MGGVEWVTLMVENGKYMKIDGIILICTIIFIWESKIQKSE